MVVVFYRCFGGSGQEQQAGGLPQKMFQLGVRVFGEIQFAQFFRRGGMEQA